MRSLPRLLLLLLPLFFAAPAPSQSLIDVLEDVLETVSTVPLPQAIGPLITVAQSADSTALAALEIAVNHKQKKAALEDDWRRVEALERIKSKLAGIKHKRAAEERKAKEDGWDPFFGHFSAGGPIALPGTHAFTLQPSTWLNVPGDSPAVASVYGVTPTFAGNLDFYAPVSAASAALRFSSTPISGEFTVDLTSLSAEIAAFDILPGVSTGQNRLSLARFGSAPRGEYTDGSGLYEVRFEGEITNASYPSSCPILVFATMTGKLDPQRGDSWVMFDDPMLVPAVGAFATQGSPKLMGAHVPSFDAGTGMLTLLENTTLQPDADVAMVRYDDGSYEVDPSRDDTLGSRLVIAPLRFAGETAPGVYSFADTTFSVVKNNAVLLRGELRDPTLDVGTGGMFADVSIQAVNSGARAIRELGAYPGGYMQIAVGPAVYDMAVLTDGFQQSAQLFFPALFHLQTSN